MEFGKVPQTLLSQVDFSFPAVPAFNQKYLKIEEEKDVPSLYFACPIWVNQNWVGNAYPTGTKSKDYLYQYARHFNSIELNSTHYHIPDAQTIQRWASEVSNHFKFSPKFPQEISHHLLPQGKAKALSNIFCERMQGLSKHLGRSFVQLPPHFAPQHVDKLERFLDELPEDFQVAVELRHKGWFKEACFAQTAELLHQYQATWVITDVAGQRKVMHLGLTQPSTMVRFVGNGLHPTDTLRMQVWAKQLADWIKEGISEIYFFMHQPNNDAAPQALRLFIKYFNEVSGFSVPIPRTYQSYQQQSLF